MTEIPVEALRADLQAAITQAENDVVNTWGDDPAVVRMIMGYALAALAKHVPDLAPEQLVYLKDCHGGTGASQTSGTVDEDSFRIAPTLVETVVFDDEAFTGTENPYDFVQSCDSTAAILTDDLIAEWLVLFRQVANDPETAECCDEYTSTMVFAIDGQKLVVVVDAGGEATGGHFEEFCDQNGIPCQFIIDTLRFPGTPVDNMYTGAGEDHRDILELVNRLTN